MYDDLVCGSRDRYLTHLDKTTTEEAILDWVSTCPCDPLIHAAERVIEDSHNYKIMI